MTSNRERVYTTLDGREYRVKMAEDEGLITYIFENNERHACRDSDCAEVNERATRELTGQGIVH